MRFITRALWAFVFFTLFAFALNNEQRVVVNWFFGARSSAPMVIVVLAAFSVGAALGVLAMVPAWWRHRRVARRHAPAPAAHVQAPAQPPGAPGPDHPPREGL
jgi:lipopolysaccharide assembly protein A